MAYKIDSRNLIFTFYKKGFLKNKYKCTQGNHNLLEISLILDNVMLVITVFNLVT